MACDQKRRKFGLEAAFAGANVTAGEVEALHADVNRVQAESAELQARLSDNGTTA